MNGKRIGCQAILNDLLLVALAPMVALANPTPRADADVVVVGLGPVGCYASHILSSHGVSVLGFERGSEAPYFAPRAVAWDSYTLRTSGAASVERQAFQHLEARTTPASAADRAQCLSAPTLQLSRQECSIKTRPPAARENTASL